MSTGYGELVALIKQTVDSTKKKADLPAAIADVLIDGLAIFFSDDVTLYTADSRLSETHRVETNEGVVIGYRLDRPVRFHFPAGSVAEVEGA